jgi:condensation enzyme
MGLEPTVVEHQVTQIWHEVLEPPAGLENSSFFELGGQSIAAFQIVARLQEQLGVSVDIDYLFTNPGLEKFIELVAEKANADERAISPAARIADAEPAVRFPFSLEQEFLRLQHENDGSSAGFGQRAISSGGWRVSGPLNIDVLTAALEDVIARHEPLRTAVVPAGEGWLQEVRDEGFARLTVVEIQDTGEPREVQAERFLNEVESGTFNAGEPPLLWAFVGRFDQEDAVLALVAYLPLIDVWSIGLILREIATCYAERSAGRTPSLAPALQYREYVAAQGSSPAASFEYWRARLDGAKAIALTADRSPADVPSGTTRVDRFSIEADLGSQALALGRSMGCSPFMVLFSVHLIQLHRLTGIADGVVWTLTSGAGRRQEHLANTVGYFVNMSPLRTDIAGCTTFRAVAERVRASCISAYPNEVPFVQLAQEAGASIAALEQGGMVVPGFALFQNPAERHRQSAGEVSFTSFPRRLSQDAGPGIPDDAILWTIEIEPSGELIYAISSSTDRYDSKTTRAMAEEFRQLFRNAVTMPDCPLTEI